MYDEPGTMVDIKVHTSTGKRYISIQDLIKGIELDLNNCIITDDVKNYINTLILRLAKL